MYAYHVSLCCMMMKASVPVLLLYDDDDTPVDTSEHMYTDSFNYSLV